MKLPPRFADWLQSKATAHVSRRRCPFPDKRALKDCRIVSHRGEHDNASVLENTIPAFDRVLDAGVWGIEFDVRWTRDLQPVVAHDPDLRRVFGTETVVSETDLAELKDRYPLIPTLEEVVARYGKHLHLMVEVKSENYPVPENQSRRLYEVLSSIEPCDDYHLMSLDPAMFSMFDALPREVFLPIAEINAGRFSRLALAHRFGGLTGHFLLIHNGRVAKHHGAGQKIGTGFVDAENCLYRELCRGVDWIFSNRAIEMQKICNRSDLA